MSVQRVAAVWFAVVGISCLGCVSKQTGKEGNLEFSYVTDDEPRNFNKPIAVGAKLELTVREAGTGANRDVTLQSVESSNPEVLKVGTLSGGKVIIEGLASGGAELTATATLESTNEMQSDAVDMMVRVPEKLKLWHTCKDLGAQTGTYLINSNVALPFEMKMEDGQSVIGYGYYPVTHEPAASLTKDEGKKSQQFIHYSTGSTLGDVLLSSDIDSTTATMTLVNEDAIDGAKLQITPDLKEGKTEAFYVLPTIAGEPICQASSIFTLETTTTDVCEVNKLGSAPTTHEARRYGWINIKGKTPGVCRFKITYTNGNAGAGSETELTVDVNTL